MLKRFSSPIAIVFLASTLWLPTGCKTATSPTPPLVGAANAFDSTTYQALLAAQASLNSLKASVAADPNLASLKGPLNQAIDDYDIADDLWQTYHAAAIAGAVTSTQQANTQTALTKVQSDITSLQTASGVTK